MTTNSDPNFIKHARTLSATASPGNLPRLLAKRLNLLFRHKSQESLGAVLADSAGTPLAEFAASLHHDLAAVQAALDLPWTTSPAEGQINRLTVSIRPRPRWQVVRPRRRCPGLGLRQFHGSSSCRRDAGWPAIRRSTSASQARGSTSFSLAVTRSEYMAAALSPPRSLPANNHAFLPQVTSWKGQLLNRVQFGTRS